MARENPYKGKSNEEMGFGNNRRQNRRLTPDEIFTEIKSDIEVSSELEFENRIKDDDNMIIAQKNSDGSIESLLKGMNNTKIPNLNENNILKQAPFKKQSGLQADGDNKVHYIQFVLDETYSMKEYFPRVYRAVEQMLNTFMEIKKEMPQVHIYFGLTLLQSDIVSTVFSNGSEYTESPLEFLAKLRSSCIGGGSETGYERLYDALEKALVSLENNSRKRDNRGIIFFTDSRAEKMYRSFENVKGIPNNGLRFVTGYLKDAGAVYMDFKFVDGENDIAVDGKNSYKFYDFERFINDINTAQTVETIVNRIIRQVSIGG